MSPGALSLSSKRVPCKSFDAHCLFVIVVGMAAALPECMGADCSQLGTSNAAECDAPEKEQSEAVKRQYVRPDGSVVSEIGNRDKKRQKQRVPDMADLRNKQSSKLQLWQQRLPWRRGRRRDALPPTWLQHLSVKVDPLGPKRGAVVATPMYGLGNRLLGAASAAGLALALNFSLSVIWEESAFHHVLGVQGVEGEAVLPVVDERGVETLDLLGLSETLQEGANKLACDGSSLTADTETPVLHIRTDQFFLPLLQLGEERGHYRALQGALGTMESDDQDLTSEVETWSHALLSGMFHFGKSVRKRVEKEAARVLSGASFILGVHYRTEIADWEKEKIVAPLPLSEVLQCVEEALLAEAPANSEDAVIFLATPSREVKKAFRKHFKTRLRTRDDIEVGYDNAEADVEAVIDMALLATSDALVTSVRSTFGYVATALARVRPYVVRPGKPHCVHAVTSAPCFHLGHKLLEGLPCQPPPDTMRRPTGTWANCWF